MNYRIPYLDILKGFGIIFVVFGHITHNHILREYIWNFHMPLFSLYLAYYITQLSFLKNF